MWKRVRTNFFSPDGSKGRLPLLYHRLNITQFVAVRVRLSRHGEGVHDKDAGLGFACSCFFGFLHPEATATAWHAETLLIEVE